MVLIGHFAHLVPDVSFVVNHLDEPRVLRPFSPQDYKLTGRHSNAGIMQSKCSFLSVTEVLATKDLDQNAPPSFPKTAALASTSAKLIDQYGFFIRPTSFSATEQVLPVFSTGTMRECFADIVIPGDNSAWVDLPFVEETAANDMEWKSKQPILFWRGSTTGGITAGDGSYKQMQRHRFLHEYRGKRPDVDVAAIGYPQGNSGNSAALNEFLNGPLQPKVNYKTLFSYKYLFDVDGNTYSVRFHQFMFSQSLLFRAKAFGAWVVDRIIPWKHYIPLRMSFTDLLPKLDWAKSHDQEAEAIAKAGRDLVMRFGRKYEMRCYYLRLLLEYERLCRKG
jgi:hypothetical protein